MYSYICVWGWGFICIGMFACGGGGVHFADFFSFFLNIPCKGNNLVSLRPNYFIFKGYKKKQGAGRGFD